MISIEQIATVCYEANRAYCHALGDDSQLPWDKAPQWQRDSAIEGVDYCFRNPFGGSEGQHQNWMRVKKEAGWRRGAVKDAEAKTHPCLVAWEALPSEQRVKTEIFRMITLTLLDERA